MYKNFKSKCFGKLAVTVVLICVVVGCALLVGCNINKNEGNNKTFGNQTDRNLAQMQEKIATDFESLLANNSGLIEIAQFIDKNISEASKETATMIIDKFEREQEEYLAENKYAYYENGIREKLFAHYKRTYDLSKIYEIEDQEIKTLLTKFRNSGYRVKYYEGTFSPKIDYESYKKYGNYLTDDMVQYIDIMITETNKPAILDSSFDISGAEAIRRMLKIEEFINTHPNSVRIREMKDLYITYLRIVLHGPGNNPVFGYETGAMMQFMKKDYLQAVIDANNKDGFIKILSDLMSMLNKSDYIMTDEIATYRHDVIGNFISAWGYNENYYYEIE